MTGVRTARTRAAALCAALCLTLAAVAAGAQVPATAVTSTGLVTGVVTGAVTAPSGVRVTGARLVSSVDGVWTEQNTDPQAPGIDPDGSFRIADAPVGSGYRLCFDTADGPAGCLGGTFPESATPLAVQSGSQSAGDVALTVAPVAATGAVRDPDLALLSGALVTLERRTASGAWEADYNNFPGTDRDGAYSMSVLPATYRVRVVPGDNRPDLAAGVSAPTTVTSTGSLPDQTLPAGRVISGQVRVPSGDLAGGIDVRALDGRGAPLVTTRTVSDGSYTLAHLPLGSAVTLVAAGVEDSTDLQASSSTVLAGSAPPAVLTLTRGATFTGTVVDADAPNPDAQVRAWDPNGVYPTRTADVTDGAFVLGGLTPGARYDVAVDPRDGRDVRYLTATGDVKRSGGDLVTAGTSFGYIDLEGYQGTVPAPTLSLAGPTSVGSTLSAVVAWRSPSPTSVRYTWYSAGTVVSGPGAANSYTVRSTDVGRAISVLVTGSLDGYRTARTQVTSGVVPAPPAPPTVTPAVVVIRAPGLVGRAKVGKRLSASLGAASPSATTSVQWLRNGAPIARATGTSYKLTKADRGRRISVRVTYARAGYRPATATSSATAAVAK